MAERITELPPDVAWNGDGYLYPWSSWLDGSLWKLTPGEDFTVPVATLQAMAHRMARRVYECRLRTRYAKKTNTFYLQLGDPLPSDLDS
jgi:hypothetical protein